MDNPVTTKNRISKTNTRLLALALILAVAGVLLFSTLGVYVDLKKKALRKQWVSRTPVGQVVNVMPAGGSGWGAPDTLIHTDKGYFSVSGGVALLQEDRLSLVELGDHSRLLCDVANRCMAVAERLELAPKETVQ